MYWFRCCRYIVSSTVFPLESKNVCAMTEHASSFIYKTTLKKATKYSLLLFSNVIMQTIKLFLFTMTCI